MKVSRRFPLAPVKDFLTFIQLFRLTIKDPKSGTRCDAFMQIRSKYVIYCDIQKSGSCYLCFLTLASFHTRD